MGLRHLLCTCAVLLAGQVYADEYVTWGNNGSIHGAETTTVTPDNRALVSVRRGGDTLDDVVLTLAEGSFERVQILARSAIVDLNDVIDQPEDFCLDAGWDFIEWHMDEDVMAFDGFGCPDPIVQASIAKLNEFIRRATVE